MDLQCSVRLLYTGDVRSRTVITFGNKGVNTGVVDLLFLALRPGLNVAFYMHRIKY